MYGSDAVAGVVNYILKDDFEGFKFQYNHNNIFEDLDLQRGYKMLFGGNFIDGKGNLTFFLITQQLVDQELWISPKMLNVKL